MHERVRLAEARDERQHHVHRRFVRANQHAPPAKVAQVLDGDFRFLGQAQQALGIVPEEAPGVGQGGVLGGPVKQPFPDAFLEPPDGLADGGLGPVQLHGRPGEAALGRNLKKYA